METTRLFAGTGGDDRRKKRPFLEMDLPSSFSDLRPRVDFALSTRADPIPDRLRTELYAKPAQLNLDFWILNLAAGRGVRSEGVQFDDRPYSQRVPV